MRQRGLAAESLRTRSPLSTSAAIGVKVTAPSACPRYQCSQLPQKLTPVTAVTTAAPAIPVTAGASPPTMATKTITSGRDCGVWTRAPRCRSSAAPISDSAMLAIARKGAGASPTPTVALAVTPPMKQAIVGQAQSRRRIASSRATSNALATHTNATPPSSREKRTVSAQTTK